MALPIILADQRLAERRGIKAVIFGKSGIGKTSLLWTLPPDTTLFFDLEAGDLAIEGWTRRHDPPAHLGGMPRLRGVHRRAEPGAARRPALQPGALRRGLREVRRSARARPLRHGLHRLDHGRRAPVLPVVRRSSPRPSRRRPASRMSAAPTACTAAR